VTTILTTAFKTAELHMTAILTTAFKTAELQPQLWKQLQQAIKLWSVALQPHERHCYASHPATMYHNHHIGIDITLCRMSL